jgi:glycosyltransferase involved in cell wall biosynthesis
MSNTRNTTATGGGPESTAPISAIVLTYNEEANIEACLQSLVDWTDELFVVDSYSSDNTTEIASDFTDKIFEHKFENYADQRNWAQNNLPILNDWIFHIDADERVSEPLKNEIRSRLQDDCSKVDGFLIPQRTYFMGRWLKHGDLYPVYHLRLFRRSAGLCERRSYDQHFVCEGVTEKLSSDLIEQNQINLTEWTARHNRWASDEVQEVLNGSYNDGDSVNESLFGTPIERRRWLKSKVFYNAPPFFRAFIYFLYRYIGQQGFRDGIEGLIYHTLQGFWFRFLVDAKLYESKKRLEDSSPD